MAKLHLFSSEIVVFKGASTMDRVNILVSENSLRTLRWQYLQKARNYSICFLLRTHEKRKCTPPRAIRNSPRVSLVWILKRNQMYSKGVTMTKKI